MAEYSLNFDPWDDRPATLPVGLLALLVDAAQRADVASLLGASCPSNPCPVCTALVEGSEAVTKVTEGK